MRLSQHFSLYEFLRSQTAARYGIDITPSKEIISNLVSLCNEVLEPLRKDLDVSIVISSGFRPLELNTKIGGSKTSAHIHGRAGDIIAVGIKPRIVCMRARDLCLPYDQNIHEFGEWTHLGIAQLVTGNRFQDLTAYRKEGKVHYVEGIQRIKDLT